MFHRPSFLSALALAALATGCVVPEGRTHVDANVSATNSFIFRGVPQVDGLSIQPEVSVAAPEYSGGTYYGSLWGNLNATDDSGDGVLPDDRGGEFSRIDLIGGYTRPFPLFELSAEVMNYNYPNFSGRSTTEVAVGISTDQLYGNPDALGLLRHRRDRRLLPERVAVRSHRAARGPHPRPESVSRLDGFRSGSVLHRCE